MVEFNFFLNFYLFISVLDLHCCSGSPLVVVRGSHSQLQCTGFSLLGLL